MQDDFRKPLPPENPPIEPSPAPPTPETPAAEPAPPPAPVETTTVASVQHPRRKRWLTAVVCLLVLAIAAAAAWWFFVRSTPIAPASTTASTASTQQKTATAALPGLQLDTAKDYGDKYADGILPVGDGKYQTTGAKQGYVYACTGYAQNLATDAGGAGSRGPWFSSDGKTYDVNKKAHVQGNVMWQASFSNTISGSTRTITTNDLPEHPTGIFPIQPADPAYAYDRNPNNISAQSFSYALAANPAYGSPNCIGGQVGIMLTGVALFSGFDAGGRDAGAWEVQDSCSGHPEKTGTYHYHTLSSCIKDTSVHTVIGFALDGFPITGPKISTNNVLTTADLDECHGITSEITLDGKKTTMYHYVMTQDFPYSVSCFRATATQPPGQAGPTTRQHP